MQHIALHCLVGISERFRLFPSECEWKFLRRERKVGNSEKTAANYFKYIMVIIPPSSLNYRRSLSKKRRFQIINSAWVRDRNPAPSHRRQMGKFANFARFQTQTLRVFSEQWEERAISFITRPSDRFFSALSYSSTIHLNCTKPGVTQFARQPQPSFKRAVFPTLLSKSQWQNSKKMCKILVKLILLLFHSCE